jgi:hypothetical protein|tara:strand:- start:597 stop:797 length:201 start_codon:yes stop_codon:yes gene_type:complete
MSRVDDVTRSKGALTTIDVLLSTLIDTINPDNNDLPIDGLHHLIAINQDCKDLIKYLNDYHSYDPG